MKKFEERGPRVDKEVMEANANPKDAPTPKFEDGYTAKTGKSSKYACLFFFVSCFFFTSRDMCGCRSD